MKSFNPQPLPVVPSEWDQLVGERSDEEVLRLIQGGHLPELRRWIFYHHYHKFVPSVILSALGLAR